MNVTVNPESHRQGRAGEGTIERYRIVAGLHVVVILPRELRLGPIGEAVQLLHALGKKRLSVGVCVTHERVRGDELWSRP
jgi:hypothetical protein